MQSAETSRTRPRSTRRRARAVPPRHGGRQECLIEITALMPLRSIADAELNTEINTETNEEDTEGNRDRVERSDHPEPDSGCENQPDHEIDENSRDDGCLLQREPQHESDKKQRHRAVQGRAVSDGGKFLVREDDRSREAHLHAFVGGEPKPGRRFAYECRYLPPGCRSPKCRTGWMSTKRRSSEGSAARPVISVRQRTRRSSRLPGLPAHLRSQRAPD